MFPSGSFPAAAFPQASFPLGPATRQSPEYSLPNLQPGGGDSRRQEWLRLKAQIKQEDEEIVEIIAVLIENKIIH